MLFIFIFYKIIFIHLLYAFNLDKYHSIRNLRIPYHANASTEQLPRPTSNDFQWKTDHLNMPGPWNMFFPRTIAHVPLITSNNEVTPTLLFLDASGRVSSSESASANSGFFILDSTPTEDVSDGRKLACVLVSGFTYHNIKLTLLGRVFMSKLPIIKELDGILQFKSALFIGHLFIEYYENEDQSEILHRLRHRVSMVDIHYNEFDPIKWNFVSMDGIGNPLRHLYGTDKWRWMGPVTGYRMILDIRDERVDKRNHMFLDDRADKLYNYFDPQIMDVPRIERVREVLVDIFDNVFEKNCSVDKPVHQESIVEELCDLAVNGPDYYRSTFT